jgi:phage terminase small subunit
MPVLKNGKHEKFVKEIFIGNKKNADAYRAVYGKQQSVFAASASANRLLKSAKIIARISELQAQVAEKHEITVDSMIKQFAETAAEAKAEKQYGPAMTGLTAIAKLAGLWVDRAETSMETMLLATSPLPNRNGSRSTSSIKLWRPEAGWAQTGTLGRFSTAVLRQRDP